MRKADGIRRACSMMLSFLVYPLLPFVAYFRYLVMKVSRWSSCVRVPPPPPYPYPMNQLTDFHEFCTVNNSKMEAT